MEENTGCSEEGFAENPGGAQPEELPVSGEDSPEQVPGADRRDANRRDADRRDADRRDAGRQDGQNTEGGAGQPPNSEGFRKAPEGPPDSPAAQAAAVQAVRRAEERVRDLEIRSRIDGQLREIAALDSEVKSLRDLRGRPGYDRLCAMVEKGYELADAWKVLNFETLTRRTEEAARQAALNEYAAKSHLRRTSVRGQGAAPVPPEMAEEYRMLNPGATDAEIQAHYNRYTRGG